MTTKTSRNEASSARGCTSLSARDMSAWRRRLADITREVDRSIGSGYSKRAYAMRKISQVGGIVIKRKDGKWIAVQLMAGGRYMLWS